VDVPGTRAVAISRAVRCTVNGDGVDKDVVRRILTAHYRPESDSAGPSWLTFIGHSKDSLWSCDLFRCESAMLRTYWVLVVMDQFTRRIIGFGVQRGMWMEWPSAGCSSDSRSQSAQIPQLGSRSAVSIPPMESQSSGPRSDRNQDRPLRAAIAPLHRATDRDHSA
jgi:hypothetical protein